MAWVDRSRKAPMRKKAIHLAAQNVDIVKVLIENGADVNAVDN